MEYSFSDLWHGIEATEDDKAKIESGDVHRASKDCVCSCGKSYGRHPFLKDYSFGITRLCDGYLVHL